MLAITFSFEEWYCIGTDKEFLEEIPALFVLELHGFLTVKAARPWSGAEGHL